MRMKQYEKWFDTFKGAISKGKWQTHINLEEKKTIGFGNSPSVRIVMMDCRQGENVSFCNIINMYGKTEML